MVRPVHICWYFT